MPKGKAVRIQQELVEEIKKEVEKGQYQSLSEFVSDAIRLRLQKVAKERVSEYIERDTYSRTIQLQAKLFYTSKHIWAKLTPQGNVRLGVSYYFENQLEGIVHVETVKEGENVSKDEPFGTLETVAWWWIHDLCSPIDGKIVRVNKDVLDDPYILNGNPYQWIVEVQPNNQEFDKELDKLLNFEEYKKLITKLEERPRSPLSNSEIGVIIKEIKSSA